VFDESAEEFLTPAMDEETLSAIRKVEASEKLAFQQRHAAELLDISARSLRNEIARRKIFPTRTLRLISKEELIRYLREETQLSRRARGPYRKRRNTTQPSESPVS
jgi:hypothetical protein